MPTPEPAANAPMSSESTPSAHALRVQVEFPSSRKVPAEHCFVESFRVGSGASCDVHVEAAAVSPRHARFVFDADGGQWSVRDLGSGEGTYLGGTRIRQAALTLPATVRLGAEGPRLHVDRVHASSEKAPEPPTPPPPEATHDADADGAHVEHADDERTDDERTDDERTDDERTDDEPAVAFDSQAPSDPRRADAASPESGAYVHTAQYPPADALPADAAAADRAEGDPASEDHTLVWALIGTLLVLLILGAFAFWQNTENRRLTRQLRALDAGIEQQAMQIMRLRELAEARGDAPLARQLADLARERRELSRRYDGYVQELGLYREMDAEERTIHRVARIFGESEFEMPASFVRRVRQEIDGYWLQEGRGRFVRAIERAERLDYTAHVVETMRGHGLPPEFFYLALQESDFETDAVGPATRWGIAKGAWQFIPRTAQAYDLRVGPRADRRVVDPQDERHDFRRATQAAADYLRHIYSTRARTSGLLVVASYNWGEHRVTSQIDRMPGPQAIPEGALEGLINDGDDLLSYWSFLTVHRDRMPEETRDYVLKVFAAAVIGENPRLFGFDFDNPLPPHMEAGEQQDAPAS